jgi:hypothetical protein
MSNDARAQFAQQLGKVMEAHRNGVEPEAKEAEAPTADESPAEAVESEASEPAHDDGVAELEQAREDLKPDADDSPEVASWKREQSRKVDRALQKNARARKQALDPEAARKAAAYDLLIQNPNLAQAVGQAGGQGQASRPNNTEREKALREWFGNDEGFDKMRELFGLFADVDLRPQIEPLYQAVHGMAGRTIEGDWQGLAAKYGDIEDYKEATFATAKRLGIPLKKALLLESDGEIVKNERDTNDKAKQRKSLTAPTQGGAAGSYSKPKPKLGGTTREDRIKSFAQGVRKQGLELPWNRFGAQGR